MIGGTVKLVPKFLPPRRFYSTWTRTFCWYVYTGSYKLFDYCTLLAWGKLTENALATTITKARTVKLRRLWRRTMEGKQDKNGKSRQETKCRECGKQTHREREHIYTYIHPSISASSSIVKIVQQEEEWEGVKIGTDAAEEGWRNKITNGRRGKHWKMNKGVCIPDEEGEGRRTVGGGRGWGRTGWRKKVEREGNGDEGRSMEMLEKVT